MARRGRPTMRNEPHRRRDAPDRHTARWRAQVRETLLGLVRDASREVRLLVETKHPTRYAGLVEKELVRVLGDLAGRVAPLE